MDKIEWDISVQKTVRGWHYGRQATQFNRSTKCVHCKLTFNFRRNVDKKRQRLSQTSVESSVTKKRVAFSEKEMPPNVASNSPMTSQSAGRSSLSKKMVLPTISEIIGGKKISPKKSLEGELLFYSPSLSGANLCNGMGWWWTGPLGGLVLFSVIFKIRLSTSVWHSPFIYSCFQIKPQHPILRHCPQIVKLFI